MSAVVSDPDGEEELHSVTGVMSRCAAEALSHVRFAVKME